MRTGVIQTYFDTSLDTDMTPSNFIIFKGQDEQYFVFRCYESHLKIYPILKGSLTDDIMDMTVLVSLILTIHRDLASEKQTLYSTLQTMECKGSTKTGYAWRISQTRWLWSCKLMRWRLTLFPHNLKIFSANRNWKNSLKAQETSTQVTQTSFKAESSMRP